MPRQPLDAPENLAKEQPCQVTFGELQREVPGVRDQAPAGLSSRCCRLVRDQSWMATGKLQPTQQIAQVVDVDAEEQTHLVGPEAVAGRPVQWSRILAFP